MKKVVLVLHNIRSAYNVGSIVRTAEGFGVYKIYATGYTPYTMNNNSENSPPHVIVKMRRAIHKTALGTEESLAVEHHRDIASLINEFRDSGYEIVGLEQTYTSIPLAKYESTNDILLILGEEVNGIPNDVSNLCSSFIEIPMLGKKESFNVSVATGIALYELRRSVLFTEQ